MMSQESESGIDTLLALEDGSTVEGVLVCPAVHLDAFSDTDEWDLSTGIASSTSECMVKSASKKVTEKRSAEVKKRKEDIHGIFKLMKQAQKLDLCFLVDGTGSMDVWINDIKKYIATWSEQLHRNYQFLHLRLAFVCYTDYDQPEETRTLKLDFTRELSQFCEFVGGITVMSGVGGDAAEDVMGGLKTALQDLSWRPTGQGTKVLIHIADDPCHGRLYHDASINDTYPDGDPAHIHEWKMMNEVKKHKLHYWFGYINKSHTDKMIQVFNEALQSVSDNKMMIEQFDARQTEEMMDAVYTSVASSISSTLEELHDGGRASLRQYTLDIDIPDFDKLPEYHATLSALSEYSAASVLTSEIPIPQSPIAFKRARQPFAAGAERLAYHAMDTQTNERVVVKEFKRDSAKYKSYEHYREVQQTHIQASMYAVDFNKEKPSGSSNIEFVKMGIVEMPQDIDGQNKYFTYEPFISGKYQKFNSNGGFVATSPLYDVTQAFSHYTWVKSGKRMVVCDIQGVHTDSGFRLTDPAIHHLDIRRKYAGTNLGKKGIRRFFKTHKCNEICLKMGLDPYTE